METLQKLFLSIFILFLFISCSSKEEKLKQVYDYGFRYYQGSPEHMNAFAYALELDSTKAETYRELSVTYLKRGIPHQWKDWYDGAVTYDPITWQPWRGYLYLWFYRDYKKAIADFDASDVLTPNFTDHPQGHSVDYWRGIAYLGLNDYKNSIAYFDTYINQEINESGEGWVELTAFLYRGIAYFESGDLENALINFDKQLQYSRNLSADAKYYKAKILKEKGNFENALININEAIEDFNMGYYNNRPYVETLRQIYMEDLVLLKSELTS
ncbi:tetratricopeptide repeat protein [Formosa maritima]|uniref:Uncharacterized protein n=1 Tax=Formosa maritima TaxID=2592046 RepID=A0A5D0G275_9FLAO|nr:hypothetical protein [Formosa maritima]TYA52429.1 hypothetical protein FVF61_13915 [Formosa maritima]